MSTRRLCRIGLTAAISIASLLLGSTASLAQLNGQNIKGDAGLKSGSQAPPGAYVVIPLWFYTADEIKGAVMKRMIMLFVLLCAVAT